MNLDSGRGNRGPASAFIAAPVELGGLLLANRLVSAPMAGVSDRAFRRLVRESGAALAFPEMVSDKALLFGNEKTQAMARSYPGEDPFVLQLLGREPDTLAAAARLVVERFGARMVDVNMGCPAPKVVRNGEGAALLRDPSLCAAIIERVSRVVPVPVSCKIRLGWEEPIAARLVKTLAEAGAAFVTVHARLKTDSYSTPADWSALAEVVASSPIPVVGNGDVLRPGDASRLLLETGCQAVMVGRGCLGNPWLFERALRLARTGDPGPPPGPSEVVETALRHLALTAADKGEPRAVLEMRKHGAWYLRGLPGASAVRASLMRARTVAEVTALLRGYLEILPRESGLGGGRFRRD
ncbi:MAG: tRNA dihydrouridine synthase DusB [Bacillota bacterium]